MQGRSQPIIVAGILMLGGVTYAVAGDVTTAQSADGDFDQIIEAYRSSPHSSADKARLLAHLRAISVLKTKKAAANPPPGGDTSSKLVGPPAAPEVTAGLALGPNLTVFLRNDFADLGSLGSPIDTANAQGAELSFTRDVLGKNTIWSAKALGAAVYNIPGPDLPGRPNLFNTTLGAYATINKVFNSNSKNASKNSDSFGGGGMAEFDVDNFLGGTHYFRFRAGGTSDRLSNVNLGSGVAEWFPIYPQLYFYRPFQITPQLGLDFRPEVLVQFDGTNDEKNKLAFNNRSQALRIGPQATLIVFSFVEDPFWSRLSGQVTYHPYYEAVSRHTNAWLKTSITYNLTDDGNVGLTASYKRGPEEDTGTRDNLYKVSLTGKY